MSVLTFHMAVLTSVTTRRGDSTAPVPQEPLCWQTRKRVKVSRVPVPVTWMLTSMKYLYLRCYIIYCIVLSSVGFWWYIARIYNYSINVAETNEFMTHDHDPLWSILLSNLSIVLKTSFKVVTRQTVGALAVRTSVAVEWGHFTVTLWEGVCARPAGPAPSARQT